METQNGQLDQMRQEDKGDVSVMAEMMAALQDLAYLSQQVGTSDAPGTNATGLLERLLELSGAQYGAILLTPQHLQVPDLTSDTFLATTKDWNVFALFGMIEEDVLALLAIMPPGEAALQTSPARPCWVTWRLLVPSSVPATSSNATEHYMILPWCVLIVLGWAEQAGAGACASPIGQASRLLPQIADGVRAVITNILLAVRVQEMETASHCKAVREMELLKAELLATVSHELRSPLASIKGYAATLLRHERRISREERHEFLLAIGEASDRLAVVIDRLLEMSQLDTDSIEIERVPVNLAHLVREAIIALEQRLLGPHYATIPKHFTFALRLEDARGMSTHIEPVISADRLHLREVLDNLLENAVNYSPEGGTIEITLCPVQSRRYTAAEAGLSERHEPQEEPWAVSHRRPTLPSHESMVEIRVRDSGVGIPLEQLERIFDRFHRVDTRLIREVNGLGLGLAICKRIVQLHGGVIWAESSPNEGSVFHVWLPV